MIQTIKEFCMAMSAGALIVALMCVPFAFASCLSQENYDKIHNCPKCVCPECERCQEPDYSE